MERPKTYRTKQSEAILAYLSAGGGRLISAGEIAGAFEEQRTPIALTTVYRHLERLCESGAVKKYVMEGVVGACYQYVGGKPAAGQMSLKCEICGKLSHISCELPKMLERHISSQHKFSLDTDKILLYGKCEHCQGARAETQAIRIPHKKHARRL
jgi:Fur family ferric uptake transcriptional regulator